MGLWQKITDIYDIVVENGDPRTDHMAMVYTPLPSFVVMSIYVTFVKLAPRYFEKKPAANLRPILIPYNIAMVLFSSYMCKEFFMSAYLAKYSLKCQSIHRTSDPLHMRMVDVFWWFYVSKIIELLDTVFLIMRKKSNQLSFLHVFHHSTMVFNQWISVKYVPGGHAFLHGLLNSFVHVIMYSYYGMACFPGLKKYLWWKKYLTMLQLLQFVTIIGHVLLGMYIGCDFPYWPGYHVITYCSILIVLFSNFYLHAYLKKQKTKQLQELKHHQNGVTSHQNGSSKKLH